MSSLSFDNIFPRTNPEESEPSQNVIPRIQASRLPGPWATPVTEAGLRLVSVASPWIGSGRRRAVDIFVAAAALLLSLPLMALAAAVILFDSEGPILFRQRRMGRHGREFTLYKFRSMRAENGDSFCITVSGDKRITRAGAFLRRYKLDELPQLWNVLRGDMGLVGPRPKLPHHEALHMTYRPGLTGAATLAFRNEEELLAGIPAHELEAFYERFVKTAKAQIDFEYMRRATFRSDLALIWRTFAACLCSDDSQDKASSLAEAAETISRYAAAPEMVQES